MTSINKNFGLDSKKGPLIAIFLDYDCLDIGLKKEGLHFDYTIILKYLEGFGKIEVAIAYGDWSENYRSANELSSYKISLKHTVNRKNSNEIKNYTDPQMISDISETLYLHPEINLFVILSGDGHFLPILEKIKQQPDKKIFVISERYSLNKIYLRRRKIIDKVITYQELSKLFTI